MTNNPNITVEWKPDGQGDEDVVVDANCTEDQIWEAITVILATHITAATGMSDDAALRAAIPALRKTQHHLVQTIGGY